MDRNLGTISTEGRVAGVESKIIKTFCTLLILMLLVDPIPVFQSVSAQARPRIYIDPAENAFSTDQTQVGATFTVTIKSADFVAPGVYGLQLILFFDKTMLQATAAAIPEGHWLTPANPDNIFIVDTGTINNASGFVIFGVTLLGDSEAGKIGGGVIATVTFQISTAPPAGGSLTSSINLGDTILVDPSTNEIPANTYDLLPATFTYSQRSSTLYLGVEPKVVAANAVEDEVNINIKIYNVQPEARLISVQFKTVLPETVSTQEDWVHQGTFFEQSGDQFFTAYVEIDAQDHPVVLVLARLLPDENGTWNRFPEGNGTLATAKLKIVSLPENLTKFPLTPSDVIMTNSEANTVPHHPSESGVLIAPTKLEDVNLDAKVNILDLATFAVAYGSSLGYREWNPKADVNGDGKLNILDAVLIAKAFGWVPPDSL